MSPRRGGCVIAGLALGLLLGCSDPGSTTPKHRERDASRDRECRDATRPLAFFYPAENRTDYAPDHPERDGCELLVADHLFCCPQVTRATDR